MSIIKSEIVKVDVSSYFSIYNTNIVKGPSGGTGYGAGKYIFIAYRPNHASTYCKIFYSTDKKTWTSEDIPNIANDNIYPVSLAVDSQGNIYVLYTAGTDPNETIYLKIKTTSWQTDEVVDSDAHGGYYYTPLFFDSLDNLYLYINYSESGYNGNNTALYFVKRNSANSYTRTLLNSTTTTSYIPYKVFSDIDNNGNIYVVYQNTSTGGGNVPDGKYRYLSGGIWSSEVSLALPIVTSLQAIYRVLIDSSGVMHVLYTDRIASSNILKYVHGTPGSFSSAYDIPVTTGFKQQGADLAIDQNGVLQLVWSEGKAVNGWTVNTYSATNTSGVWSSSTLIDTENDPAGNNFYYIINLMSGRYPTSMTPSSDFIGVFFLETTPDVFTTIFAEFDILYPETVPTAGDAEGLFGFNPDGGCFELMVMEGGTLYGWPSSGSIILRKTGFQGLATTMIKAGQQSELDVLIIANGIDTFVMYRDHTFHDMLDTVYSCPKTRAIAYYGNRLWALKNNLASFSDAFPPTYYPTAAVIAGDQTTFAFSVNDAVKLVIDGTTYDNISLSGCASISDVANAINTAIASTVASVGAYPNPVGGLVITSPTTGTSSSVSIDDATSMKNMTPPVTCILKLFYATNKSAGGYAPFDRNVNAFRVPVGEAKAVLATRDQGLIFMGLDQIWQLLPSQIPNPTTDIPTKVLDIGCVAGYTAVQVADDIIFLAADGVRGLFRTALDKLQTGQSFPLSYQLQDQFDQINWDAIDGACATFFENKYIIALPINGANYNNVCWVYYPSLSTSFYSSNTVATDAASRAWVVYTGWNIQRFAVMNVAGRQNLYGVDAITGQVYQLFKGKNDNGNAIDYDEVSRAEDFKNPLQYKYGGEYKVRALGANGTITVKAMADDNTQVTLGTITLPTTGVTFPTTFPVIFTDPSEADGVFHLDDSGIIKFKRVEFETECDVEDAEVTIIETLATAFQEPYVSE